MIALIRKEYFDRVHERLRGQNASVSAGERRRPLVGLVRCVACNSLLVLQGKRGGREYYVCRNAKLRIVDAAFCSERLYRADVLEDVVRKVVSGPPFDDEADGGSAGGSS